MVWAHPLDLWKPSPWRGIQVEVDPKLTRDKQSRQDLIDLRIFKAMIRDRSS